MLLLTSKRQDFLQFFCFWKTVLNKSGSGIGTGAGTGTATNHYGSTALALRVSQRLYNSVQEVCYAAVVFFGRVECWLAEAFAAAYP